MGTVQVAIGVNGFRLEPQPKAQPHGGDLLRKSLDTTGELFAIDGVIAKPRCITVSRPEPAVIKDKQLGAGGFCLPCQREELCLGKIEEMRLPVIEEDGAWLFFPLPAQNVLPHKAVEIAADAVEALR